ncbi:MAG: ATP-dependent DNA helicase RecQ [Proteobacteria bacterium]|nr:ATP-dependent DNA helicase RecQ [Pseudomonadota bacterium]
MSPSPQAIDSALTRLGYAAFRPGQREAIEQLFDRGRLLLVAPTGGGKSLCYQLPALVLPGTTLVVSPLIALMQDQVAALEARGVAATYLASTLDPATVRERLAQLARGAFRLVYVAPERLTSHDFRQRLAALECPLVAIDEAHCISEWGHDFRRDYLQLGALVRELAPRHVLACTATATPVVRDEIVARLGLPPTTPQLVRGFARPNLALRAVEVAGARQRTAQVDAALGEALGAPRQERGAAILYTPTRRLADESGARLASAGWRAVVYHAGLEAEARATAQRAFTAGTAEIVCATNAFGMGIDRADVRAVIHLGPPGSLEAYYQEVGRAGRDGHDALGLLCWSQQDLPLRRRLLDRPIDGAVPDAEIIAHKWNLFLELIRWAEGGSCRHDAILRYFGDEAETLAGCGRCDVCTTLDARAETEQADPQLARILLSGVARIDRRFGLKQAVRLLHGDPEERLERLSLHQVPTFGRLRDRPPEWIQRALSRCVTAGWVAFSGEERPLVHLTRDGVAVMRGERPARWQPPPATTPSALPRASRSVRAELKSSAAAHPADETTLDAAAQSLFEALRAARLALSQGLGVPAYVVAHDRTLRELARQRPRDGAALQQVPGFGPQKTERFGPTFLEVIAAHPSA